MPGGFIPPEQINVVPAELRIPWGGPTRRSPLPLLPLPPTWAVCTNPTPNVWAPGTLFRGPFYVWDRSGWSGPPLVMAAQVLPSPVTKTQDSVSS